ncbi:MAG: rod shape-determining protein MreC [Deltaproteobacteria bacterium HGW-Deltaproteobacteria-2]|jgi:rod shape-determining protein MreC|nr:MAG: rod shape-determining protein MreC [Deltaproteobacteria bacterium HGW-Deltaproteobacteria-2]
MFFLRKYKTAILIIALLVIALMMLSFNLKYGAEGGFFSKIVLQAVAPVQKGLNASIKSIRDAWLHYIFLVGIEEENKNLKKKINELKSVIISYQESYLEAQRLKKLLSLTDDYNYNFIPARVIGREQAALSKTILINKGTVQGLKTGMPVVVPPGLIGRLVDVSWHASKVLLFIDENSNIDAIVQRTRMQGIISGAGSRGLILKYISKTQDVQEGDVIISSGMGGVFPKGLLIGQVSHVDRLEASLFLKINVAPFVDFSKLEEVLILASSGNKTKQQ